MMIALRRSEHARPRRWLNRMAERPRAGPSEHHAFRLASTTAPTMAARSRIARDLERRAGSPGTAAPRWRRRRRAPRPPAASAHRPRTRRRIGEAGAWAISARAGAACSARARSSTTSRPTMLPPRPPTRVRACRSSACPRLSSMMTNRNTHHDRAGVDQHLDRADELRVEQHVDARRAEHRVHQPERRAHRTLARDERDRRAPPTITAKRQKNVEERRVRHLLALADRSGPTSRTPDASAPSAARGRTRSASRLYSEFS